MNFEWKSFRICSLESRWRQVIIESDDELVPNKWQAITWIGVDEVLRCCTASRSHIPDSKVHGANMGPIWGRQDPGGPHVGPMSPAISYDLKDR